MEDCSHHGSTTDQTFRISPSTGAISGMNDILFSIFLIAAGYLLGSIPSGLIIVKLVTGKDIRKLESGRTGGTNVGRVAGLWAGIATAFFDGFKGLLAVWLVLWLRPDAHLTATLAPVAAVLGHNYSIFLVERNDNGRLRLRGGAGGATTVGGAVGLWFPALLIVIPAGAFVLFVIGYASLATLTVGVSATVIFLIRAIMGLSPWEYVLYGILVEMILLWALRPNIRRLMNGTERVVGLRARRTKSHNQDAGSAAKQ
jgi:acyl phosphate:glycerol-3-phosphate acyltransferase